MGCSTSNDVMPKEETKEDPLDNGKTQIPQSPNLKRDYPIAFEVPFHDLETVGKKPLPPKLQRLQEQQPPEPEETLKTLQKRLADAEERRHKVRFVGDGQDSPHKIEFGSTIPLEGSTRSLSSRNSEDAE